MSDTSGVDELTFGLGTRTLMIGDDWSFPFTLTAKATDGTVTPENLSGATPSALLYVSGSSTPLSFSVSADADTNLAAGKFKFVVPKTITATVPPDSPRSNDYPTRIQIVITDAYGSSVTKAVVFIRVLNPRSFRG